jgi:hypothetical protein
MGSTTSSTPGVSMLDLERSCKKFLRAWAIGDPEVHPDFTGVRRARPLPHVVSSTEEYPSQEPMPELDGMMVVDENGEAAVIADIIPLESVGVTRAGRTIRLEFNYCVDYPPEVLGRSPGPRVVVAAHDPRLWMWTVQCLDALHGSLGDAAAVVAFEVEVLTDRFETLVAEERTLPG